MGVRHVHLVPYLHSLWGNAALNDAMIALAQYGLAISLIAIIAGFIVRRPSGLIPWLLGASVVAVCLVRIAGHVIFDPRPFVVLATAPLAAHAGDNGFPSDHSAVASFVAATLWFIDARAAAVATLAALAIGVARVYVLVHWPIDVIAGWVLGAAPAVIAMFLWRKRNG